MCWKLSIHSSKKLNKSEDKKHEANYTKVHINQISHSVSQSAQSLSRVQLFEQISQNHFKRSNIKSSQKKVAHCVQGNKNKTNSIVRNNASNKAR